VSSSKREWLRTWKWSDINADFCSLEAKPSSSKAGGKAPTRSSQVEGRVGCLESHCTTVSPARQPGRQSRHAPCMSCGPAWRIHVFRGRAHGRGWHHRTGCTSLHVPPPRTGVVGGKLSRPFVRRRERSPLRGARCNQSETAAKLTSSRPCARPRWSGLVGARRCQ
jgi:hypothetical protein